MMDELAVIGVAAIKVAVDNIQAGGDLAWCERAERIARQIADRNAVSPQDKVCCLKHLLDALAVTGAGFLIQAEIFQM